MRVYSVWFLCVLIGWTGCDDGDSGVPEVQVTMDTYDPTELESKIAEIETQLEQLREVVDAVDLAPIVDELASVQASLDEMALAHDEDRESLQNEVLELSNTVALNATTEAEIHAELQARIDTLEGDIEELMDSGAGGIYTDDMAVAAVQNLDPWSDPDAANLTDLWSKTERGFHHLTEARWTMDNRSDPAGLMPRHELVQMFHETPECVDGSTFADCNSTGALKMYVNGPRITDHDWSDDGFNAAARRPYNTHASGIYIVSFGQGSTVSDMPYPLIPPSGIHLEPRGDHQGLRIDGGHNSGENIRIDTTLGATGISILEGPVPSPLCGEMPGECERSHPLYIRGGRLHLEDIEVARSAVDSRGMGIATLHSESLGIEQFYSWHIDAELSLGVPVHCTWNSRVSSDTMVKLTPYSTSPDLAVTHSYVIMDVWGPGDAPEACRVPQNIKTDAYGGVYGHSFGASMVEQGGFTVALLGPESDAALDPGVWRESRRPSFMFELFEPL